MAVTATTVVTILPTPIPGLFYWFFFMQVNGDATGGAVDLYGEVPAISQYRDRWWLWKTATFHKNGTTPGNTQVEVDDVPLDVLSATTAPLRVTVPIAANFSGFGSDLANSRIAWLFYMPKDAPATLRFRVVTTNNVNGDTYRFLGAGLMLDPRQAGMEAWTALLAALA